MIALRLKKNPQQPASWPHTVARGHVPLRPMPPPPSAPRRTYAAPAARPTPVPDTGNDLVNFALIASLLNSDAVREENPTPAVDTFRSGDGGDFGGGGASGSWDTTDPTPDVASASND